MATILAMLITTVRGWFAPKVTDEQFAAAVAADDNHADWQRSQQRRRDQLENPENWRWED